MLLCIAKLKIEPYEKKTLILKSGRLYIHVLVVGQLQHIADTNVTLAFEDASHLSLWSRLIIEMIEMI